jgi:hypothetical protein
LSRSRTEDVGRDRPDRPAFVLVLPPPDHLDQSAVRRRAHAPEVRSPLRVFLVGEVLTIRVVPRLLELLRRHTVSALDDLVFIARPDLAVVQRQEAATLAAEVTPTTIAVLEVNVPMTDEVEERSGRRVTRLELLSPVNKLTGRGRDTYLEKRTEVLRTRTSLVEIDLLRAGEPMPVVGPRVTSDYRILVSRGARRPRAHLYAWTVRQPIPTFVLPLLPGDAEPAVDLGVVLHALYDRARLDLRLNYTEPPVPPLAPDDATWAAALIDKRP